MTTTALPDALPAPDLTRRDSMGRLVAATWHSAGASPAGTGRARWLVAVDGSACALRAGSLEKTPATSSISRSSSAAIRWIGPMNAPGPPPIMPIRKRRIRFSEECYRY